MLLCLIKFIWYWALDKDRWSFLSFSQFLSLSSFILLFCVLFSLVSSSLNIIDIFFPFYPAFSLCNLFYIFCSAMDCRNLFFVLLKRWKFSSENFKNFSLPFTLFKNGWSTIESTIFPWLYVDQQESYALIFLFPQKSPNFCHAYFLHLQSFFLAIFLFLSARNKEIYTLFSDGKFNFLYHFEFFP